MSKASAAAKLPEKSTAPETAAPIAAKAAAVAAVAADKPAAVVPEKPAAAVVAGAAALPPIPQNCWALKEYQNPGGWLCVPTGYTVDHLLDPSTWANIAGKGQLRPYSTIEVHWADRSQFATFYLLDCGRNWAQVELLTHHVLGQGRKAPASHRFEVSFNGPVDKYRIVNLDNNTVLQAGFATELDAQRFLVEHRKKIE